MRKIRTALAAGVTVAVLSFAVSAPRPALAAESGALPHQQWSFDGLFGTFDRAALRRGFTVYKNICSACHSMRLLYYRNLADIGFSDAEVKKIASEVQVTDGPNDEGEMFERPGKPSDHFKSPFPNEKAARAANNGRLPPDFSLLVKSVVGGPDFVYGILTGFKDAPPGYKLPEGTYYNEVFPGHNIGMPPPLSDGAVDYADGTKATLPQEAHDVATFLTWASEPKLETRKQMGIKVILFLIVLTGLLYVIKRRVWKDVH